MLTAETRRPAEKSKEKQERRPTRIGRPLCCDPRSSSFIRVQIAFPFSCPASKFEITVSGTGLIDRVLPAFEWVTPICCGWSLVAEVQQFPRQNYETEALGYDGGWPDGKCRSYGNPQKAWIPTAAWGSPAKSRGTSPHFPQALSLGSFSPVCFFAIPTTTCWGHPHETRKRH